MRMTANEVVQFLPFELSTVEYLPPKDAIKVTSGAIYGALVIKTRGVKKQKKDIPAQGIQYIPMGLANMDFTHTEWETKHTKSLHKRENTESWWTGFRTKARFIPVNIA